MTIDEQIAYVVKKLEEGVPFTHAARAVSIDPRGITREMRKRGLSMKSKYTSKGLLTIESRKKKAYAILSSSMVLKPFEREIIEAYARGLTADRIVKIVDVSLINCRSVLSRHYVITTKYKEIIALSNMGKTFRQVKHTLNLHLTKENFNIIVDNQ